MAKRASERGFFGADERDVSGGGASGDVGDVADGSSSGGGGDGGWGEETVTPRKSFVMRRAWGSMKMVEVRGFVSVFFVSLTMKTGRFWLIFKYIYVVRVCPPPFCSNCKRLSQF